jgi:transketolase
MPLPHSKRALDPVVDAALLRELRLAAIEHRRKLLTLGRTQRIRLHYGAAMSSVEILTALYMLWLRVDPGNVEWAERDRFVLSKGHAAPALYVTLAKRGFFPEGQFAGFRRLNSILQGHPDRNKTPGVDCSTGSLGQGFPVACGMALGAQIDRAPYRVFTLISDGECNEGSVWEAALIAANLKLDSLTALVDWNRKSSYGPMQGRNDVEPLADKWRAFGWATLECDGHDFVSLTEALAAAEKVKGQPSVVLCHTVKGKGIPFAETHPTRSNFALTPEQDQEAVAYLETLEAEITDESFAPRHH